MSPSAQQPGLTLKGIVGQRFGNAACRSEYTILNPDDFCELDAEVCITNPAIPSRGAVRVNDEGMVLWDCHLTGPHRRSGGITLDELVKTIASALAVAGQAN